MRLAEDKNNWRNNDQIVSKVDENYKHTDPGSSMNLKKKNDEEKHREAHHYQIVKNQWLRILQTAREKNITQRGKRKIIRSMANF